MSAVVRFDPGLENAIVGIANELTKLVEAVHTLQPATGYAEGYYEKVATFQMDRANKLIDENERLRQTCEYNEGDSGDAAELQRFREREESALAELFAAADAFGAYNTAGTLERVRVAIAAVRDFKVTP